MTKLKEQQLYHLKSYSRHANLDEYMNFILSKRYGRRFAEYRNDWHECEKQQYIPDFPLLVGVETVDICNYSCSHCYRAYHRGSKVRIDLQTFRRIVEEGKQYGAPCLVFGGGSEPMLNSNIMEMIKYALDNEIMDVFLGTNGTKLAKENIDQMIEWGLTRLEISLDAVTPETYKKVRGGDLGKIEKMVKYAYERREAFGRKLPIIRVSFVVTEENYREAPDFVEKWKDIASISGPPGLRLIKGFHDEALSGRWKGYRSSRLGLQWRVIYRLITEDLLFRVASITAHDYRRL